MSRHRNIEEEFRAIAPASRRGIPSAGPIAVGITGSGGADSLASLSIAAQEIKRLEDQFRQQSALIQANTMGGSSSVSSSGGGVGNALSGVFGGGLGIFSPVLSGLLDLFGAGGAKTPEPEIPYYVAPPSVQIGETLRLSPTNTANSVPQQQAQVPHVIVNVSAMDSQSFLDRSNDIASAVREAMLNLHPINDVVASL